MLQLKKAAAEAKAAAEKKVAEDAKAAAERKAAMLQLKKAAAEAKAAAERKAAEAATPMQEAAEAPTASKVLTAAASTDLASGRPLSATEAEAQISEAAAQWKRAAERPVGPGLVEAAAGNPRAPSWIHRLPHRWRLGVILGPTASGKSRAMGELRTAGLLQPDCDDGPWPAGQAVVSAIADSDLVRREASDAVSDAGTSAASSSVDASSALVSADEGDVALDDTRAELAMARLGSVGLNSLPAWMRPFAALSNGQRARADMARRLASGVGVDDFGSTVDGQNACVCAAGVARTVRLRQLDRVVLASVHEGLVGYMGADWAYFPQSGALHINPAPGQKPRVNVTYDEQYDAQFARSLPPLPRHPVIERAACRVQPSSVFGGGCSKSKTHRSRVTVDHTTSRVAKAFDVEFNGEGRCHAWRTSLPDAPPAPRASSVPPPELRDRPPVPARLSPPVHPIPSHPSDEAFRRVRVAVVALAGLSRSPRFRSCHPRGASAFSSARAAPASRPCCTRSAPSTPPARAAPPQSATRPTSVGKAT